MAMFLNSTVGNRENISLLHYIARLLFSCVRLCCPSATKASFKVQLLIFSETRQGGTVGFFAELRLPPQSSVLEQNQTGLFGSAWLVRGA